LAYWLEGAPVRPEVRQATRTRSASPNALDTSRGRLRLALAVSISVVIFLGFVLRPPERFAVAVDGARVEVVTRDEDVASVLGLARVDSEIGDVIVKSGNAFSVERAVPVVMDVDGQLLSWRTRAVSVQALLDEMGIEAGPYDGILVNGNEVTLRDLLTPAIEALPFDTGAAVPVEERLRLNIIRAVPLTIVEDGRTIGLESFRPTVALALRDAGVQLGPADEVYPSPSAPVVAGMDIEVKHAKAISLRTGASTRVIYTHQESLRDALAEAGFALGEEDRVEPSIEALVSNGMTARLVRVAGRTFTEKEPLERKTVFKPDDTLTGYATRVVPGRDGVSVKEFKVVIEDGVERQRTLVKEYMEPEAVDTVIYYPSSANANGAPDQNYRVVETKRMWATWYNAASSGKPETHDAYGITASGMAVTRGIVAVDPRVIPLGSRLYIPGYGFAVAGDTGGGIVGDMIDLGFADGAPVDWRTGYADVYLLAR
jgi:uncharacterized protein YabE (DUF348 family)/3D (Asp-Asp-Asp) domain-containing protein